MEDVEGDGVGDDIDPGEEGSDDDHDGDMAAAAEDTEVSDGASDGASDEMDGGEELPAVGRSKVPPAAAHTHAKTDMAVDTARAEMRRELTQPMRVVVPTPVRRPTTKPSEAAAKDASTKDVRGPGTAAAKDAAPPSSPVAASARRSPRKDPVAERLSAPPARANKADDGRGALRALRVKVGSGDACEKDDQADGPKTKKAKRF